MEVNFIGNMFYRKFLNCISKRAFIFHATKQQLLTSKYIF
ncbi:hypothetical protein HMPREF1547_00361 [Blautia sp. KLE 1732]|nr:hypothetical protein HMPREF1547_00361 [Blautia sp. KLE 1732]